MAEKKKRSSKKEAKKTEKTSKGEKKEKKEKKKVEIDPLKYFLTPKMRVLGEKSKKEIIEKYGGADKLAKILASDPAVKALKAKVGDVIEIERDDYTGTYKYYRIVVEG